jgi:hypothetical protein
MRLSPLEQNIVQPDEMESRIRTVIGNGARSGAAADADVSGVPRAATIILPDLSVRFAVLTLQDLPWSSEERDAVVRWRLGQDQLLSLSGAKVFSQVLSDPASAGGGPYSIFAVVVQETVLAQYESVCEAAGVIPQEIDVASLRLFNLWVRGSGGPKGITADYLWVNATDGGFTALVFRKGQLVYVRSKLSAVGTTGQGMDAQSAGIDRIVQECADSMYACQQQIADLAVSQVVLVADEAIETELQNRFEKGLGVTVKAIEWDQVSRLGKGTVVGSHSVAALPAFAGVM